MANCLPSAFIKLTFLFHFKKPIRAKPPQTYPFSSEMTIREWGPTSQVIYVLTPIINIEN